MGIKSDLIRKLETELSDAKKDLHAAEQEIVFRTGQIDRLNATLTAVRSTLTDDDDQGTFLKKANVPAKTPHKSGLPRLGNDFWLKLISDQPKKVGDILEVACMKLNVSSLEGRAVLKNRMTSALTALVESKSIASEGEQQKRTFSLPKPEKKAEKKPEPKA